VYKTEEELKNFKAIERIIVPPPAHMVGNGFRVHNFFPGGNGLSNQRMSPFFLLDYNSKIDFSPSDIPRGVGTHPHRGFETVTIAYKGSVAHHDSRGNSGVIEEGDVQWMTAASGILHKEYHEEAYSKKGGPFQMVQLWVNLPAKDKMSVPKYQHILQEQMGKFQLPVGGGTMNIIAGEFQGIKGVAHTFTPLHVYDAHLNSGSVLDLFFPEDYNTGLLIIEGRVKVNGVESAPADHFVLFKNEGSDIRLEAQENAIVLVLSGKPIHEPIAQYGPFLMNTHEELQQALDDVRMGKFGVLEN
jgi:redox-sensitive bicupin YhaK (pirin superfamily)